ncbi:hypothetical protein JCM11641_005266 [Rhodosporidiobolus odoratus]
MARHHRRPHSDSDDSTDSLPSTSGSDDDDSPSTGSSDDSRDEKRSSRRRRHSSESEDGGGRRRRRKKGMGNSDEGTDTSDESSDDDEPRHRRSPRHGGRRRDSDEDSLIGDHHRRRKSKRRRGGAGGPPPANNNNNLIIGGVILVIVLILAGGAYWFFFRDAASSSGSDSTSGSSGSSGDSAGTGSGSGSGSGAGSGSGSGSSAAGGSGKGSEGGGSKTSGGGSAAGSASKTSSGASASSSGGGGGGGGGGGAGGTGMIAGFWENWSVPELSASSPLETKPHQVSYYRVGMSVADTKFDKYDICYWFTAVPGTAEEKGKLTMGESTDGQAKEWVAAAQKANCKAILTVGGWSGSNTFTKLVATDTSRSDFVDTLATAMNDYGFDGIDIDWEYPGKAGNTEDFDAANDLNNLLEFVKALREKIGKDKFIAADTSSTPWVGADGNPSSDLSEIGGVLDWILIMTYDSVTYSSKTTGPNFAYDSKCAPSGSTFAIPSTVQAWIDAKFPAEKILLGLASYGYAWNVADFKDGGGVDGASSSIYQTASKTLDAKDGSVSWDDIQAEAGSMEYTFDNCTSTPFLYGKSNQLFIAYDDADSFAVKGGYAGQNGLKGCGVYAGMTQDKDGVLADAARKVC